jgi:hypothetical protein
MAMTDEEWEVRRRELEEQDLRDEEARAQYELILGELSALFGPDHGGGADWSVSAWFVGGDGGGDVPLGRGRYAALYKKHSVWIIDNENDQYCVVERHNWVETDPEYTGNDEIDELFCAPPEQIEEVIARAREEATRLFGAPRQGNPAMRQNPLLPGHDRETVSHNIREMMHKGRPQKQAVAIALENARRHPNRKPRKKNPVGEWRPGIFTFDGSEQEFNGIWRDEFWNGWAVAYFDAPTAVSLLEAGDAKVRLDAQSGELAYCHPDSYDCSDPSNWGTVEPVDVDGRKVYSMEGFTLYEEEAHGHGGSKIASKIATAQRSRGRQANPKKLGSAPSGLPWKRSVFSGDQGEYEGVWLGEYWNGFAVMYLDQATAARFLNDIQFRYAFGHTGRGDDTLSYCDPGASDCNDKSEWSFREPEVVGGRKYYSFHGFAIDVEDDDQDDREDNPRPPAWEAGGEAWKQNQIDQLAEGQTLDFDEDGEYSLVVLGMDGYPVGWMPVEITGHQTATEWARRTGHVDPNVAHRSIPARLENPLPRRQGQSPMLRAYIQAALFTSTDESDEGGGEPLDKNYKPSDIAEDTLAAMASDVARFERENAQDLLEGTSEQGGHDLWLTRNGHGAGFWDGDWPEPAMDRLTEAAEKMGPVDLYVGDDGQLHQSPLSRVENPVEDDDGDDEREEREENPSLLHRAKHHAKRILGLGGEPYQVAKVDVGGTSRQATLKTTEHKLRKAFGMPTESYEDDNDGAKMAYEWHFKGKGGPFTVYTHKGSGARGEWSVGGKKTTSKEDLAAFMKWARAMIKNGGPKRAKNPAGGAAHNPKHGVVISIYRKDGKVLLDEIRRPGQNGSQAVVLPVLEQRKAKPGVIVEVNAGTTRRRYRLAKKGKKLSLEPLRGKLGDTSKPLGAYVSHGTRAANPAGDALRLAREKLTKLFGQPANGVWKVASSGVWIEESAKSEGESVTHPERDQEFSVGDKDSTFLYAPPSRIDEIIAMAQAEARKRGLGKGTRRSNPEHTHLSQALIKSLGEWQGKKGAIHDVLSEAHDRSMVAHATIRRAVTEAKQLCKKSKTAKDKSDLKKLIMALETTLKKDAGHGAAARKNPVSTATPPGFRRENPGLSRHTRPVGNVGLGRRLTPEEQARAARVREIAKRHAAKPKQETKGERDRRLDAEKTVAAGTAGFSLAHQNQIKGGALGREAVRRAGADAKKLTPPDRLEDYQYRDWLRQQAPVQTPHDIARFYVSYRDAYRASLGAQ